MLAYFMTLLIRCSCFVAVLHCNSLVSVSFGNLRAMAMEPVGHIAGIAAAVTGFISTIMAVPISIFIGRFISDTALPLFVVSICAALVSLLIYLKISEDDQYKFLKLNAVVKIETGLE
jgi:ABC-type phosphate transport system permease subunit